MDNLADDRKDVSACSDKNVISTPWRICLLKILKPTTPTLAVVRECRACLFMATTSAHYAAAKKSGLSQ